MGDSEIDKKDLQRKIEEVLHKKAPDKDKLNTKTFEDILEEINVYHQELEYQNQELMRIRDDLEMSQQHFKTLFDEAPVGYVLVNIDLRIVRTNKYFPELLGVDDEEIIGMPLHEIIDPGSQDDFYFMARRVKARKKIIEQQLKVNFRDRKPITVKAFTRLVMFPAGEHFLFTFSDISTELTALEKAMESDRLKTAFLNNMSHEVRTPLNCIIGFASLLANTGNTPEESAMYAGNVVECGHKLNQIIDDIIVIAAIEAGQEVLSEAEINLDLLFDEMFERFNGRAADKHIDFSCHNHLKDKVSIIIADGDKLKTTLHKLLDNAIKFTNAGNVALYCRISDGKLQFHVKDSGIGIAKEHYDVIFDRFRQLDFGNQRKSAGNGLGLAIAKACVELMGGRIWLESELNSGSSFYFTIPYQTP